MYICTYRKRRELKWIYIKTEMKWNEEGVRVEGEMRGQMKMRMKTSTWQKIH